MPNSRRARFKETHYPAFLGPPWREIRRRTRRPGGIVHWAAAELEVSDDPIAVLSYGDATERMLVEHGPLTPTEIVVHLKEAGYKPNDDPRSMLRSLMDSFKRNRKRFTRGEDGRWAVA